MGHTSHGTFAEYFSGEGGLTDAVRALGVTVLHPDDILTGGVDFSNWQEVRKLFKTWRRLAKNGPLWLHFAPPLPDV